MGTNRQTVREFLLFDGVNLAYVAEQLYGKRGKITTAKLHNKLHNVEGRDFTDKEIDQLNEIRKSFITHLV